MADRVLPKSELEILRAMWELGHPAGAAELNAVLNKGWRVQTLITHLSRMEEKGVIYCRRGPAVQGIRCFYEVVEDEEAYLKREAAAFAERIQAITQLSPEEVLKRYQSE